MNTGSRLDVDVILARLPAIPDTWSSGRHEYTRKLLRNQVAKDVVALAEAIRSPIGSWDRARINGHSLLLGGAYRDGGDALMYGLIRRTQWVTIACAWRGVEAVIGRDAAIEWAFDRVEWGELMVIPSPRGFGGFGVRRVTPVDWAEVEPSDVVLDWLNYAVPFGVPGANRMEIKKLANVAKDFFRKARPVERDRIPQDPDEFGSLCQTRHLPYGKTGY